MTRRGGRGSKLAEEREPVVLVFGESDNDRRAIQHLLRGLRKDLRVELRRDPLVLIKGANPANAKSNAEKIAALARADPRRVLAVVAHQDCDAVEPAHEAAAAKIESELASAGCPRPSCATSAARRRCPSSSSSGAA